jgi:hypothetical protein
VGLKREGSGRIQAGQAHVQDLDDLGICRQEQVGWLDVAMNDASLMGNAAVPTPLAG